jgi:methanogenic corrinoid protein MtbC1
MKSQRISSRIYEERSELAEKVIEIQWERNPDYAARYGKIGKDKCRQDTEYHFLYLSQAAASDSFTLFREYLEWVKILLRNLHLSVTDFGKNLEIIREVIQENYGGEKAEKVLALLDKGITVLPELPDKSESVITEENPYFALASEYLRNLKAGNRQSAVDAVMNSYQSGVSIKDLYTYVFQPVQKESGRLWQSNEISVAQEHFITAATQLVMGQLYPFLFQGERKDLEFMGSCVGNELHELGIRMICDFFEMEGWNTYYIGANIPVRETIKAVELRAPDVLGLSTTISYHLKDLEKIIQAVRSSEKCTGTKIMVGGMPFNRDRDLWKSFGADGTAVSAEQAIREAVRLMEEQG